MTRATLLQLLAQPTALTGADVRALEELAEAFPYCQTAHLLLAKAAHDQGSMLAGQRLRRAATYAADRTLLRQLIELPAPVAVAPPPLVLAEVPAAHQATNDLVTAPYPPLHEPAPPVGDTAAETAELPDEQRDELLIDVPEQELVPVASSPAELAPTLEPEPTPEPELPPQAPPIRPPAEAAVASTEFGLAYESPVELAAYQLAGLLENPAPARPVGTPLLPPFTGVADVAYAPTEGSRLGFCLLPAAGRDGMPATGLPPTGEFFAPDALLLAHVAAQQPEAPKARPLDLINSFLQRAPAASRRRALPTLDEEAQADLSVRSTRAEPDLASESLAKILARQGKVDRAIAIYERLMVKQPEKMAYFAAQIDSLRPSA
ncbi:hypothetical protein E4631_10425 [Hymenobacter sp. UV11]|uniref:hypothetical protein n=1 Tax=Hymenobacter sp. UV11 TaxID=1849735 RepID=UPI0010614ED9|nr:hypothetical protein [Hymenobacter sp. UV11]TDN40557.1 hypothetical protein A8B98_14125 [Hymenobacter sp. UV11]TFZ66428.1 hypothetical protein E4631_10425 [Hymenobacter sp. UV11]